jgi:predicted outer membrane protein
MAIAEAEGKHPAIIARDFNIIQGRPAKKAEAMMRDFCAAGGNVKWHALDDTIADATFAHPQGGTVRITWDMERAKQAGLTSRGDMYRKYPRAMLRSRCVSEGVRTVAPFATSGVYTPEEVRDMIDETPTTGPLDVTPAPPSPAVLDEFERADHLAAIEAAADLADLKRSFATAYAAAKQAGDVHALNDFERAKDRRKAELTVEGEQ